MELFIHIQRRSPGAASGVFPCSSSRAGYTPLMYPCGSGTSSNPAAAAQGAFKWFIMDNGAPKIPLKRDWDAFYS